METVKIFMKSDKDSYLTSHSVDKRWGKKKLTEFIKKKRIPNTKIVWAKVNGRYVYHFDYWIEDWKYVLEKEGEQ